MNTKNKLSIGMGIFFCFTLVAFGTIVLNEKKEYLFMPKIKTKIEKYTKTKYIDIYNEIKPYKIEYNKKDKNYEIKYYNTSNNELYFYVKYKNKKITDTYKKDYLEGKTLLSINEKRISNNFKKDKKIKNFKIHYTRTLNNYSKLTRDKIINNTNTNELGIYNVECNMNTNSLNKDEIKNSITYFKKYVEKNHYKVKSYSITLKNKNDISQYLKINNIDEKIINDNLNYIINGIIKNENLSKYNITYSFYN